jgi:hypothetical protein
MVVHCVFKVSDSYKKARKLAGDQITRRVSRPLGAIAYDDRILTFKQEDSRASIMTVEGRERVPYVLGPGQREMMPFRWGEATCVWEKRNGF